MVYGGSFGFDNLYKRPAPAQDWLSSVSLHWNELVKTNLVTIEAADIKTLFHTTNRTERRRPRELLSKPRSKITSIFYCFRSLPEINAKQTV